MYSTSKVSNSHSDMPGRRICSARMGVYSRGSQLTDLRFSFNEHVFYFTFNLCIKKITRMNLVHYHETNVNCKYEQVKGRPS